MLSLSETQLFPQSPQSHPYHRSSQCQPVPQAGDIFCNSVWLLSRNQLDIYMVQHLEEGSKIKSNNEGLNIVSISQIPGGPFNIKLTVSNLSSEEIEMFVECTTNCTRSPNTDLSRQCEAASTPFLMSTL